MNLVKRRRNFEPKLSPRNWDLLLFNEKLSSEKLFSDKNFSSNSNTFWYSPTSVNSLIKCRLSVIYRPTDTHTHTHTHTHRNQAVTHEA